MINVTYWGDINCYRVDHLINMSNVRDTTNFTTKCLQTDMASYVEVTHQQLKHQITNSILIFNINKSLIVDVLPPHRMPCQFVSIWL